MRIPRFYFLASVLISTAAFAGGETQLRVAEVMGHSDLRESQVISGSREILNGTGARLQIDSGESIFRLGANSSAIINDSGAAFRLQDGNCLFADLSANARLMIRIADKNVEIVQGTGFAYKTDEHGQARLIVGCIAGNTRMRFDGGTQRLKAGELLVFDAKAHVTRMNFDLAEQIKTCALITDFKAKLPNPEELEKELARFAVLKKRGFIGVQKSELVSLSDVENPGRRTLDESVRTVSRQVATPTAAPPVRGIGGIDVIDVGFPGRREDDVLPPTRPGTGPPGHEGSRPSPGTGKHGR
jgi:hypothetical protein